MLPQLAAHECSSGGVNQGLGLVLHHCCIHERQAGEASWQCNTSSHGHGSTSWHGRPTWHEAYGSSHGGTNGHATWRSNGHASRNASSYGNASFWRTRYATWDGRTSRNGWTTRDGWTPWDAGLGTSRHGNATRDATSHGLRTPNVIQRGLIACFKLDGLSSL